MTRETTIDGAGRIWDLLVFMAEQEGPELSERVAGYVAGLRDALHLLTGEEQESIRWRLHRELVLRAGRDTEAVAR